MGSLSDNSRTLSYAFDHRLGMVLVMLVNFCFQVVVGHFFWEYIWTFDVDLKCLSKGLTCFLILKPHLGHDELHKRKNLGVKNCFHGNVNQFCISINLERNSYFFHTFFRLLWTFFIVGGFHSYKKTFITCAVGCLNEWLDAAVRL